MKLPVYMDYHATTPVDPRVVEAMLPYFTEKFGNPASRQHQFGWIAEEAVSSARAQVAHALNAEPREIIFTSGATESNNLALKGVAEAVGGKRKHVITCATEHKSVLDVCKQLAREGIEVTVLPVDKSGLIDLGMLRDSIEDNTILVSIMIANNEIGTIQPIAEIGAICRERGILFHTDATQAVGKIPVDVQTMNIDLLSLSGHKVYGPKGVGALYIRARDPRVRLKAQIDGGGHERGLRSGTPNVPAVVGLGKAIELSRESMGQEGDRIRRLRDKLEETLKANTPNSYVNGHPAKKLPNNLNMSFLYAEDNAVMLGMKDVAVASGSACSSAEPTPSHVLRALGIGVERETSAIRFGLGRWTTEEEVDFVARRVIDTVDKVRSLSPGYKSRRSTSIAVP
jgi:cysteine desulfurase